MSTEEWFEEFWSTYPSDLAGGSRNKGAKQKAFEVYQKKVKDQNQKETLIGALRAQIRYDREAKERGDFVPRWPMVTTWINQGRWDVEIESHQELRLRTEVKLCHCSNPVIGPRFSLCSDCYFKEHNPYKQERRQSLEKMGLMKLQSESMTQWGVRCREVIKPKLKELFG